MMNFKWKTVLLSCIAAAASGLAAAQGITVTVDGKPVQFPTGQPMEWNGHVMVPLRGVFENLGATVDWDGATQAVTVTKGTTVIKLTVGDAHALKNQETIVIQSRTMLREGTVYVPLRFLAESLDANVAWDGASRIVKVTTQATIPAPSQQRKPPPPL